MTHHLQLTLDLLAIVTPFVGLALLAYVRVHKRSWPDLWRQRRNILPALERVDERLAAKLPAPFPNDPKLSAAQLAESYAGHIDAPPAEVRQQLRSRADVFPRNAAMCKFLVRKGRRTYEVGSYAHLSDGFASEYQTHIRLYHGVRGGTDVYAHYELSPWVWPWKHYGSTSYDIDQGVRNARELLDIRPPGVVP